MDEIVACCSKEVFRLCFVFLNHVYKDKYYHTQDKKSYKYKCVRLKHFDLLYEIIVEYRSKKQVQRQTLIHKCKKTLKSISKKPSFFFCTQDFVITISKTLCNFRISEIALKCEITFGSSKFKYNFEVVMKQKSLTTWNYFFFAQFSNSSIALSIKFVYSGTTLSKVALIHISTGSIVLG